MTVAVRKVVSQGDVMNGSSTTVSTLDGVEGRTDGALEQPQRSRNARAQARHRAKRKAYIEQVKCSLYIQIIRRSSSLFIVA